MEIAAEKRLDDGGERLAVTAARSTNAPALEVVRAESAIQFELLLVRAGDPLCACRTPALLLP